MTSHRANPDTLVEEFHPEDYARQVSNPRMAVLAFGGAIAGLIIAVTMSNYDPTALGIGTLILFGLTLVGVLVGFGFLMFSGVYTKPSIYHRVTFWPKGNVIGIYGTRDGGWGYLPVWHRIETKPFYRAETLYLSNKDFEEFEIEPGNKTPVHLSGNIAYAWYPDRASASYRNRLIGYQNSKLVNSEVRHTALAIITLALLQEINDKQKELESELKDNLGRNLEAVDIENLFDLIAAKLKSKEAETGIIVVIEESFVQKVFSSEIEREITRALAARLGFEALMQGDFSLEQFARARAAFNARGRYQVTEHRRTTQESETAKNTPSKRVTFNNSPDREASLLTKGKKNDQRDMQGREQASAVELSDEEAALEERRRRLSKRSNEEKGG